MSLIDVKIKEKLTENTSEKFSKEDFKQIIFNKSSDDELNLTEKEKNTLKEFISRESNLKTIKESSFNPFSVLSKKIILDLLTDSGTSRYSKTQLELIKEIESNIPSIEMYSYARPTPRELLNKLIKELFGEKNYFYLTGQGRASEFLLLNALLESKIIKPNQTVISNRPFDTTKGHIQKANLKIKALTPMPTPKTFNERKNVFLGNIKTENLPKTDDYNIILITVTDNGGGGQPVSMNNYKEIVEIARKNNKLVWLDACRILENALFIKCFEKEYEEKSVIEIAKEMINLADVTTISFKKIYSHSGGGILINKNSKILENKFEIINETIQKLTTVIYGNGFNSYSGRTGKDMIEIITGLIRATSPKNLYDRITQVSLVANYLKKKYDLPLFAGGHALYVAAEKVLPNVSLNNCPAEYLNAIMMASLGIRGCGLGNIVYTQRKEDQLINPLEMDSLRLAIPRDEYSTNYLKFLLSIVGKVFSKNLFSDLKGGLKPIKHSNDGFFHFRGKYDLLDKNEFDKITTILRNKLEESINKNCK